MHITWHGNTGIKIQAKEGEIAIDPPKKADHTKQIKKADVAIITDFSEDNIAETAISDAKLTISHPGEYELAGIMVHGFDNPDINGEKKVIHRSTIYKIKAEDIEVAHLGHLKSKPSDSILDKLGVIDVLFLPISKSISPADASKMMNEIEPRIVIPISIADNKNEQEELINAFLKETGTEKPEKSSKILLKKKNLEPDETKIMLLDV